MPIYEYKCRRCETVFEAIRPVGDDGKSLGCPDCGARAPVKVPSTFATTGGCGPAPSGFG